MPKPAGTAPSRRRFLKSSGTVMAMIPLVNLVGCGEEPKPSTPAAPAGEPQSTAGGAADAARDAMQDRTTTPAAPADAAPTQAAPPQAAPAQKMARLEESDPQAQALGYKHDAGAVDTASYARYQPGQLCSNCALYQADQGGEEGWGGCGIFPGKLVAGNGWCNAYVPAA